MHAHTSTLSPQERASQHLCPTCGTAIQRRPRESTTVFMARKFCDQTCYFNAIRAKIWPVGGPFGRPAHDTMAGPQA